MFIQQLQTDPQYFLAVIITVVVSISLHELAHGVTAIWLGDRTPIETGHMTLNPAVHMGVFSVILLLLAGIAWGSMPVTPSRLRGRHGDAIVALAGPLSNVLLAVLALGGLGLWDRYRGWEELSIVQNNFRYFLVVFGFVNIHLAIFNLIPIPPLDGSRMLASVSRQYGDMMDSMARSGGLQIAFIFVFLFASRVTGPAASWATDRMLTVARGY